MGTVHCFKTGKVLNEEEVAALAGGSKMAVAVAALAAAVDALEAKEVADLRSPPDMTWLEACAGDEPKATPVGKVVEVGTVGKALSEEEVGKLDRTTVCKLMAAGLKKRSGKAWSVTGGKGTAWGWLRISAPPSRRDEFGNMTVEDTTELAALLGDRLPGGKDRHGYSVPSSRGHWAEYLARCEGYEPPCFGVAYWD